MGSLTRLTASPAIAAHCAVLRGCLVAAAPGTTLTAFADELLRELEAEETAPLRRQVQWITLHECLARLAAPKAEGAPAHALAPLGGTLIAALRTGTTASDSAVAALGLVPGVAAPAWSLVARVEAVLEVTEDGSSLSDVLPVVVLLSNAFTEVFAPSFKVSPSSRMGRSIRHAHGARARLCVTHPCAEHRGCPPRLGHARRHGTRGAGRRHIGAEEPRCILAPHSGGTRRAFGHDCNPHPEDIRSAAGARQAPSIDGRACTCGAESLCGRGADLPAAVELLSRLSLCFEAVLCGGCRCPSQGAAASAADVVCRSLISLTANLPPSALSQTRPWLSRGTELLATVHSVLRDGAFDAFTRSMAGYAVALLSVLDQAAPLARQLEPNDLLPPLRLLRQVCSHLRVESSF